MKTIFLILSVFLVFFAFLFVSPAAANDSRIDFTADCDGFVISGEVCADWSFHDGTTITYDFEVNGSPVFGFATIMVESDIFECIPFEITESWQEEFCGDLSIEGSVSGYSVNFPSQGISVSLDVSPFFCPCACTRSHGYYKKSNNWPDGVDSLVIGGLEYSKRQLIQRLKMPVRGDMAIKLSQHLITAMLNVINEPGNNTPLIQMYISMANFYLADPTGCDKHCVKEMKDALDDFNNSGEYLCD